MKPYSPCSRFAPVGAALVLLLNPAAALHATDSSGSADKNKSGVVAAQQQHDRQSARRLIGQDVKTVSGEGLGQVKDLVIEAGAGRIVYALVGSGGLLGVGEKIRAVPFAAFRQTGQNSDLALNVARSNWDSVPTIREDEIDLLADEARGNAVFEQFGLNRRDEMKRGQGLLAGLANRNEPLRLMRATKVTGQQVVNAGQEVGKIEDVIVNYESRRASVLIDPNDDYTGTDHKFVIAFSQLTPSLDDKDRLTTTLTRAEFAKATPAREDWWTQTGGYPYIWTGDGTIGSPVYTAVTEPGSRATREAAAQSTADLDPENRASAVFIRGALRTDSELRDAARDVSIDERGNRLVISGVVSSEKLKEKIGKKVAEVGKGWMVDNTLTVRAAAE